MSTTFRTVAYAAWGLAFGLSIWLAIEFHEYKFGIALGVAILALILSAFGLILARHCGQQKDRLAMAIGIVLWAAGAVSFAITELGFWSSSYKDRHAEYVHAKKAKDRQEGMTDMAWEALRTGEARATSAEIEARIKASQMNDRWAATKGCTDVTTLPSKEFCQGYFELQAKLASAGKMEALEARLLGGNVETKETIVHNVFAAADLLADNSSLSEREAATLVVLTIALVLMLSRDLLLIVANPFGGATGARTAAKASPHVTQRMVDSIPVGGVASLLEPRSRLGTLGRLSPTSKTDVQNDITQTGEISADLSDKSAKSALNSADGTDFDGPGTPLTKPEVPSEEVTEEPTNVIHAAQAFKDANPKAEWKIEKRASENSVTRWLRDRTVGTASGRGQPAHKLLPDYNSYCRQRGEQPLTKRKFSTVLRGELDLPKLRGADGKRKSGVMLFPIELVTQSTKKAARAA